MKTGIIFDLDGTLWDTSDEVRTSWNQALRNIDGIDKQLDKEEMDSYFGKLLEEIFDLMLPDTPMELKLKAMKSCCEVEEAYLREHGGNLYPDLEVTLRQLKKDFDLFIVSNCQDGYIQTFLEYHKLEDVFLDIEMAGRTKKPKGENIKIIMERNNIKNAVYVGDTAKDREASQIAGVKFVYASYGFGNLHHYDYRIDKFSDLIEESKKF